MSVGPADPKSLQALPTWVVGAPIPPAVRIGKLLQGEYLIKGILGEGELGVTYEAENARLRRKFAVLMLKRELKPTQGMMLQVRDDLRHAEPLINAGIMPVKMIVDHMMIPGFATELLEGETLRARLSRGPLPPPRALATVLAVAKAMDALHKAGAVHGDLRPENIFLVRPGAKSAFAGRVMVVEHALHALRRRSQGLDDQLPLYKLMYRPPECLAGESGPHVGGDVFVLGAILHECLTGRPAFYDEVADFVIDNLNQPPKPIAANPATGLTTELASTLSVLVASACARDPQMRTPDMAEIIVAIEQVVQGAGLTLPTVITEEPQAVPAAPATPTASRMNRLLNRLSGVFPQVPLPPLADAAKAAQPAAADKSGKVPQRTSSPPAAGGAPVVVAPQAISLPPIAAPRTKVTRLLQKLSGVFPVLQATPDGNVETLPSTHPKVAGGTATSQPPAQAAPPASAPQADKPAASPAAPDAAPAAKQETAAAQSAQPTLLLGDKPAAALALLVEQSTPQPAERAALLGTATPASSPAPQPGLIEATTQPALPEQAASPPVAPAATQPHADAPVTRPKTTPPLGAAEQGAGTAAAPSSSVSPSTSSAAETHAASAAGGDPAAAGKSSEVAKALALLRQQQQARQAGQPVEALRAGPGPATPGFVVPSFMAGPAGGASTPPAGSSPAASVKEVEDPSSSSQKPTMPPIAAGPGTAHPPTEDAHAVPGPAPAGAPPAAGPALAAEAVTPAISLPPSAFSPTGERPPAGAAAPKDIAFDSTLQPNDLADFMDAAKSLVESQSNKGPTTLSEIPTRPAALAGLDPIPQYTEAKTQPALRRLPITEQATQAKLPADLMALASAIKGPGPAESDAPAPATPSVVVAAPSAETAPPAVPSVAITAPAAPPPAPPAASPLGFPSVPRDSIVELDPLNLGAELEPLTPAATDKPPSPPPPPPINEKPAARPRPPRVSQLIKALQQGQIDPLQAMQQASGSPRDAAPAGPRATGANPLATGGQPIGPAASGGSGPAQGRVSPGLMPMAPPTKPAPIDSPWGTATQQVTPAPRPSSQVPVSSGLRGFVLRNQELVAAVFGALFVLLVGLAYLLLR